LASSEDRENPVWERRVHARCRPTVKGDELRGVVALKIIWRPDTWAYVLP